MNSLFLLFSALLALSYAADLAPVVYPGSFTSQFVFPSSVTSTNKTVVKKDVFQNPVFQDRTYNVVTYSFPYQLYQAAYLSLHNDDKKVATDNYVSVNFTTPMSLWIAFDARATSLPAWMNALGLSDSGLVVRRTDTTASGYLDMKVYYSLTPRMSVTLGGPKAPGADSAYIPYFLLASYSCSTEYFSDNFFTVSEPGNDFISTDLYFGWQHPGQIDWRYDSEYHRVGSRNNGYRYLLTRQQYISTTFTLKTSAESWGTVNGVVNTAFFWGVTREVDAWSDGKLYPRYDLVWNTTSSKLLLTYNANTGSVQTLASKTFSQQLRAENVIIIIQDTQNLNVFIDNRFIFSIPSQNNVVGRFGWYMKATGYIPNEVFVDYLTLSGTACNF